MTLFRFSFDHKGNEIFPLPHYIGKTNIPKPEPRLQSTLSCQTGRTRSHDEIPRCAAEMSRILRIFGVEINHTSENMANKDKNWEILESEYVIRRPWLTARKDKVRMPNGVVNDEHWVLEYPEWVNVIAITTDGKFVMEHQYRHGLRCCGYELCAGVVEDGEDPLDAGKRELYEETGFGGGKWTKYMAISANPSTTSNLTHSYIAEGVERISSQHLEETEDIEVVIMTAAEVRQKLLDGEIMQALMAAPLWRYFSEHPELFDDDDDSQR